VLGSSDRIWLGAALARDCSPATARRLRAAEELALGNPDAGLGRLREVQRAISGRGDDDIVAVVEMAVRLADWGANVDVARQLCETALAAASAEQRGRLLVCRARMCEGIERRRTYTAALSELSISGSIRERALVLGEMSFPWMDDGPSADYWAGLAREGLSLALESGDQFAIASCAGRLASCETYLGSPGALGRWRRVVKLLPAHLDGPSAEVASLNHLNCGLFAAGLGRYREARKAFAEGSTVAHGPSWASLFSAADAFVLWRSGALTDALRTCEHARAGTGHQAGPVATVVQAACSFERDRRPDTSELAAAVGAVAQANWQLGAAALAIQARIRSARREPQPQRGLAEAIRQVRRRELRFGWEDLLMALAEINPGAAGQARSELEGLWPVGERAEAAGLYIDGLLGGRNAYRRLVAAGTAFEALPEPISAGAAFHAAARAATRPADGNRWRSRAAELYQAAGADRSLANVLRDRQLRRNGGAAFVPISQRYLVNPGLTPREHEVAALAARGLTAQEIGERLCISVGTARNHIARIREKLGGVPKRRLPDLLGEGRPA
jgi:DNA-binding CsgD family transcriptional regulator